MIDTATALNLMNDTYDLERDQVKTFGLRFISKGGFREIYNARKGVKHPKQQRAKQTNRGKSHKKYHGVVQIFDEDIQEFRDIKFAGIVGFRDYNTTEWIRVRLN